MKRVVFQKPVLLPGGKLGLAGDDLLIEDVHVSGWYLIPSILPQMIGQLEPNSISIAPAPLGKSNSKNVLVHRLGGYGDILYSLYFLKKLKEEGKTIWYSTFEPRSKLVRSSKWVDKVINYPYSSKVWEDKVIYNLEGYPESSREHTFTLYKRIFGYKPEKPDAGLNWNRISGIEYYAKRNPYILIAPSASAAHRSISPHALIMISQALKGKLVAIFERPPSPQEQQLFNMILVNPSIEETINWLINSEFVIATDSFLSHLALLFHHPVLTFYGSFDPASRLYQVPSPLWIIKQDICKLAPCFFHGPFCPITQNFCINNSFPVKTIHDYTPERPSQEALEVDLTPINKMLTRGKEHCPVCGELSEFRGGLNSTPIYYCPKCKKFWPIDFPIPRWEDL